MDFNGLIKSDIDMLFDSQEFYEKHIIDGTEMNVIVDDMELLERNKRKSDFGEGLYSDRIMIYVKSTEFGELPRVDSCITVDDKYYNVISSVNEYGVYSITLEANRS